MNVSTTLNKCVPYFLRPHLDRLQASPLAYRLVRGAFWSLAGAVISRGLGLLASILVARMLGKEGFGELGIIQSTVGMFGVFAGFGLGLTATKHVAEFRAKDPAKAGRIISLSELVAVGTGATAALILFLLAPWLATHTLAAPHLAGLLRIAAIMLFLGALNGAQTGALAGFEAFKTIARLNLLAGIAAFPLMVGGVYLAGLKGAVWGLVASMGVNWLLNRMAIKDEARSAGVPFSFSGCMQEYHILWDFSVPALLASAMVGPVNWACNAMLVNQPNGYAEMGIFNAANQWYGAMLFLPGVLGQVVLPMLSEGVAVNDRARAIKTLTLSIKLNAVFVTPLLALSCIFSPLIMKSYGESFSGTWPTLIVVLLTAGLLAVQTPVGHIIAAAGRMWTGCLMNVGWALAYIGITALIVNWGALGVATARAGAYLLHATWTFGFAYGMTKKIGTLRAND